MITRTRARLVPFALCAMGALAIVLAGCRKEEAKPETPASSPKSYMNDEAFMGKLESDRLARQDLEKARAKIVAKMKAMVDAKKAELKTDDPKAVLAELEKDPEWKSLYSRCVDANTAITEQRRRTQEFVRGRIAPKRTISK